MKTCTNCNSEVPAQANVCGYCGTRFASTPAELKSASPPPKDGVIQIGGTPTREGPAPDEGEYLVRVPLNTSPDLEWAEMFAVASPSVFTLDGESVLVTAAPQNVANRLDQLRRLIDRINSEDADHAEDRKKLDDEISGWWSSERGT